jgi:hypothetical protein
MKQATSSSTEDYSTSKEATEKCGPLQIYKSKFEEKFRKILPDSVTYEPDKLKFKQPEITRTYIPDWKIKDKVYIETKGKLTSEDRKKMIWVKEQYPDYTFYIFFQNARVKIRKGSKTSYGDWATKVGFEWSDSRDGLPKDWLL